VWGGKRGGEVAKDSNPYFFKRGEKKKKKGRPGKLGKEGTGRQAGPRPKKKVKKKKTKPEKREECRTGSREKVHLPEVKEEKEKRL